MAVTANNPKSVIPSMRRHGQDVVTCQIDPLLILSRDPFAPCRVYRGEVRVGHDHLMSELGSDLVPDSMTTVRDGEFYGWPYSYFGQNPGRPGEAAALGSRPAG